MKSYAVIGLGRFGSAVAIELCELGNEVLAIDLAPEKVQAIADDVTHGAVADARDPAALKALGVRNFDCAIVAMGGDIGTSALVTLSLKELGLPTVICKAKSHIHRRVLEKIGADRVIFPEHESGVKLAQTLTHSGMIDFIELSDRCGIIEVHTPQSWQGRTIQEIDVRKKYHVNIIAIRDGDTGEISVSYGASYVLRSNDVLLILGEDEDTAVVHAL